MNARRRRGEQVIDEEDEEYRGDDNHFTNIGSLAIRPLCQTGSKALEISREITLLSPQDSRAEDQTWTA